MKKIICLLPLLALLTSCDLLNDTKISSTDVGGDGNLTMNAVGTKVTTNVQVGGTTYTASSTVTSNVNGVVTMDIRATLPRNNSLVNLIPANLKDASGNLSTSAKYKNTSEGILDYTNKDGKPLVIVNYSSNVGDKYTLTKSDGTTITRTVTAKTEVDDYPVMGGSMMIKDDDCGTGFQDSGRQQDRLHHQPSLCFGGHCILYE